MRRPMTIFLLLLSIASCAGTSGEVIEGEVPIAGPVPAIEQGLTIGKIRRDPSQFYGMVNVYKGTYHGYLMQCGGYPPVRNDDWVLDDGTGCIYVSGMAPQGLNPNRPMGEILYVTGSVKFNRTMIPYIEAKDIKIYRYK